jgi:hypothetical protein
MKYLLLFYSNDGYANAPKSYVHTYIACLVIDIVVPFMLSHNGTFSEGFRASGVDICKMDSASERLQRPPKMDELTFQHSGNVQAENNTAKAGNAQSVTTFKTSYTLNVVHPVVCCNNSTPKKNQSNTTLILY